MTSNNRVITSVDPQSLVEVNLKENQQRLILTNLYKSRDDGKSDQVVLECQDGQILAHKSVLRSGSDYFRGMFTHATTENEFNRVLLHDTSIEVMNIIIKFIYAQDIPSRLEMTGALMAETLIAADKMQLNILFNNYWILFTTPITLDNFSNIWQLAELLTKEDTIHKVQVFLIIHMKQLMEAEFLCDMTVMQLESLVTKVKPHKLGEFIILLATWGLKTVKEESNTENVLNLMTKCELKKLPQYSLKHLLSNEIVRKLAPIYNILSKEASSRWSTMPKKQQIQIFAFAVRSYGLCRFSVSFLDDLYPAVSKTGEIYYFKLMDDNLGFMAIDRKKHDHFKFPSDAVTFASSITGEFSNSNKIFFRHTDNSYSCFNFDLKSWCSIKFKDLITSSECMLFSTDDGKYVFNVDERHMKIVDTEMGTCEIKEKLEGSLQNIKCRSLDESPSKLYFYQRSLNSCILIYDVEYDHWSTVVVPNIKGDVVMCASYDDECLIFEKQNLVYKVHSLKTKLKVTECKADNHYACMHFDVSFKI